jgi:excisionase family DNA binding protein
MPRVIGLARAARILRAHVDTVADAIKHRGLPACKVGRSWLLIEDDLVAWIRTQYDQGEPNPETTPCDSTDAARAAYGGPTSPSRASRALSEALAPRTKPRRANGPPKLRPINGGKPA